MLEYFYLVFIAPLEWIMRHALEWGYAHTDSYGIGIVVMSIVVNVLLLPLYHLAETWQESERSVQSRMATQRERIQRVFKGRERYMLMRTLHRQHNYHPIMAVRTSFGFLIQVPFFFAAYHFLSNYAPLQGVSFGLLTNLGQPDALLTLGGMSINVLPFAMTAINVLSALVYTHRLTTRDKIQLYGIALLFLVLLYDAAAGLVFYWTCNNIFSLLKNIVYEKYQLLAHGKEENTQIRQSPAARIEEYAHKAVAWLEERTRWAQVPLWCMCLIFVAGLGTIYAQKILRMDLSMSWQVATFVAGRAILLCVLLFSFIALLPLVRKSRISYASLGICLSACLAVLLKTKEWYHSYDILVAPTFYTPLLALACIYSIFLLLTDKYYNARSLQWRTRNTPQMAHTFIIATALLGILIFFRTPYIMYASDPQFFNFNGVKLGSELTLLFAAYMILCFCVYYMHTTSQQLVLSFACTIVAFIAVLYAYFLQGNYGVIDHFRIQLSENIVLPWHKYADAITISTSAAIGGWIIFSKGWKAARAILSIALVVSLIEPFIVAPSTPRQNIAQAPSLNTALSESSLPAYAQTAFRFSKTERNIVIFMLDQFTGGHVGRIMTDHPDIEKKYTGFVWYPDTMSSGHCTSLGISPIIGGESVQAHVLNETNNGLTLSERISKAYALFVEQLLQLDFTVEMQGHLNFSAESVNDLLRNGSIQTYSFGTDFTDHWKKSKNISLNDDGKISPFMIAVGLFRIAPFSLRPKVYDHENWLGLRPVKLDAVVADFAWLDMLAEMSSAHEGKGVFKYFINNLTHFPWQVDATTYLPTPLDPYPDTKGIFERVDGEIPEHVIAETAALKMLGKWLDWLKAQGIYDNTMIVLVSDHGIGDSAMLAKAFGSISATNAQYPGHPHALLMVKDFGATANFAQNNSIMSNVDVQAIILSSLARDTDKLGIAQSLPWHAGEKRVRWHSTGSWDPFKKDATYFYINQTHKVTGTMFNKENWEMIK